MTAAYKNAAAVLSATSTQTLATTSATSSPSSSSSSSTNLGVIIGGVVGGVIGGLILVSVVVFYVQRRRKENHATPYPLSSMIHNTSPSSFIQSVYDTPTGSCMLYVTEDIHRIKMFSQRMHRGICSEALRDEGLSESTETI
ncbi:hypothetical protein J3A83DRAFT_4189589 [Scleroderma citrinum]